MMDLGGVFCNCVMMIKKMGAETTLKIDDDEEEDAKASPTNSDSSHQLPSV